MQQPTASPLTWPLGYPRTETRTQSRFLRTVAASGSQRIAGRRHTIADASRVLFDELERLRATEVVLSTNLRLKINGEPHGQQGQPSDPGACVYFKLKGKPIALPCDKWQHVECNIYAIAKHIESLRGQERWGVGNVERAFAGYMALEEQTMPKWFQVLECTESASLETIEAARRALVKRYHPDGTKPNTVKFSEVSEAYRIALELRK